VVISGHHLDHREHSSHMMMEAIKGVVRGHQRPSPGSPRALFPHDDGGNQGCRQRQL